MIKHSKIKHHIYLSMMNGYLSNELYLTLEQYITEQEKKDELLGLYQLKDELREHYAVNDSALKGQEILNKLRQVCEEINIKKEGLEELKDVHR